MKGVRYFFEVLGRCLREYYSGQVCIIVEQSRPRQAAINITELHLENKKPFIKGMRELLMRIFEPFYKGNHEPLFRMNEPFRSIVEPLFERIPESHHLICTPVYSTK